MLIWKCQKPVSLARCPPPPHTQFVSTPFTVLSGCQAALSRVGLGAGAQL